MVSFANFTCMLNYIMQLLTRESIFINRWHIKSRDITLSTKVHIVKAMAFPVFMYGCESWTLKKAEH